MTVDIFDNYICLQCRFCDGKKERTTTTKAKEFELVFYCLVLRCVQFPGYIRNGRMFGYRPVQSLDDLCDHACIVPKTHVCMCEQCSSRPVGPQPIYGAATRIKIDVQMNIKEKKNKYHAHTNYLTHIYFRRTKVRQSVRACDMCVRVCERTLQSKMVFHIVVVGMNEFCMLVTLACECVRVRCHTIWMNKFKDIFGLLLMSLMLLLSSSFKLPCTTWSPSHKIKVTKYL